jgi:hypothetical protein
MTAVVLVVIAVESNYAGTPHLWGTPGDTFHQRRQINAVLAPLVIYNPSQIRLKTRIRWLCFCFVHKDLSDGVRVRFLIPSRHP